MSATHPLDPVPSKTLYHYTSVSGLIGIARTKCLWATHVTYMNDAAEIRYAIKLLGSRVAALNSEATGDRLKCLTQLNEWLQHEIIYNHLLFVCSFTTNGNLLSQWRAYCPPGKGVSLGFHPDALVAAADAQAFYLTHCLYEREQQLELLDDILHLMVATADDLGEAPPSRRHPTQSYYDAFERHIDAFLKVAARIKHPAFAEEDEWRAISRVSGTLTDPGLQFREGLFRLTPYVEFALPRNGKGSLSFEHVFVGPAPEANLAFLSVDWFLTKHGAVPKQGITSSQLPWRTW